MSDLTDKQLAFVEEYQKDFNATQAAIRAGYSEKTAQAQASRLLSNVKVQAALEQAGKQVAKRNNLSIDRVVQELAQIAFSDIRKAVRWGETVMVPCNPDDKGATFIRIEDENEEDGYKILSLKVHTPMALIASDQIDDATAAAIQEVKQTKEGLQVKFHPKSDALKQLYAHLAPHLAAQQQAAANQTVTNNYQFNIDARNQALLAVDSLLAKHLTPASPQEAIKA